MQFRKIRIFLPKGLYRLLGDFPVEAEQECTYPASSGRFVEPIEKIGFHVHGLFDENFCDGGRSMRGFNPSGKSRVPPHRHCLRQTRSVCARKPLRPSKPSRCAKKEWIASRSLSSGGAVPVIGRAFARPVGADPLARNDGAGSLTSTASAARAA